MIIGVPKEIKTGESRVGVTESGVKQLVHEGHRVLIEKDAGRGSGISNAIYRENGAEIIESKKMIYSQADMIVKVKEPLPEEYDLLKENQILYCYLHLAAEPQLTKVLCQKKIKSIAFETIEDQNGSLPLLVPMSEVAGRLSVQIGISLLQKNNGGKGILLGGVTGVKPGQVTIIGGGVVGINALAVAVGLGASVTILDIDHKRLEFLEHLYQGRVITLYSNEKNIFDSVVASDLLIGAVLITGYKAPCLVTRQMIDQMENGSVVVDVAVDQGGCIETCRPTNHKEPTYTINDVIHYCVPNIPGITPRTSTYALSHATSSYMFLIARENIESAMKKNAYLKKGLNTYGGHITYEPVAKALNQDYVNPKSLLASFPQN